MAILDLILERQIARLVDPALAPIDRDHDGFLLRPRRIHAVVDFNDQIRFRPGGRLIEPVAGQRGLHVLRGLTKIRARGGELGIRGANLVRGIISGAPAGAGDRIDLHFVARGAAAGQKDAGKQSQA